VTAVRLSVNLLTSYQDAYFMSFLFGAFGVRLIVRLCAHLDHTF